MHPPRVFAYGSLMWRPGFTAIARAPAVLRGWSRRFWQSSTDHRGVPEAPGRVVTLVRNATDVRCHGIVLDLDLASADEILARLDVRESGGYVRSREPIEHPDGRAFGDAWVWIAHPGNERWAGEIHDDALHAQIRGAHGPSGPNLEYVLELADALVREGIVDAGVAALAEALRSTR